MSGQQNDRACLVTGATSGIGREIVVQLRSKGFPVYATGRNQQQLDALKQETGCEGSTAKLDSADETLQLYKDAVAKMGKVDVLVNNAGYSNNNVKTKICDETIENFDLLIAINVRAPFILCREAMKDMTSRGEGHILNVVSTVALTKQENFGVYSASKYALDGLTGSLAKEGRMVGVKVTAVYPGGTDTNIRLEGRPQYMTPKSAAAMIVHCIDSPEDVCVDHITYRPMAESNF